MRADERFANPAGIIQGGFIGAMADSAMGSATVTFARAAGRRVFSSNVEMKTSFLAPARGRRTARVHGPVVSGGRRVAFAEAEVVDDRGGSWPGPARPICSPSGTEGGVGRSGPAALPRVGPAASRWRGLHGARPGA